MSKLIYGVDDKPRFPIMVLAGAQHVLTLFGATTLVPLIFGPAMNMTPTQIGFFISCVYMSMGLATLIQTSTMGSRLPIVQGSSFSFIPPIMTIIGVYGAQGANVCLQYIGGALILGGFIMALIGYTGLVGKVRRFITPVTVGPTIMAIGFSLAPVAIGGNAANYWPVSLTVVILIFLFSLGMKNRYINIFSILSSVVIVYLLCLVLSSSGVFTPDHPAYIDLSSVIAAKWFQFTGIAPWGAPKFSLVAFGAIVAGFFAVFIESIGDYYNVSHACGLKDPSEETINKGIGAEGLGCAIGGLCGGVACTSYTENIGLIGLTGVGSRWVVRTGAVLLIVMSCIGKLGALVATIPTPIIGGCYIALFGIIGALGIQALSRADMNSQRNVMIVGFSFLMALGLPGWVEGQQEMFFSLGIFGQVLWAIGKTAMAVAGICAGVLDNVIPGTDEERGIRKKESH
ncbi:purine/pyrimidine permease [Dethiosulfovibrio sp. F2B]|uniref:uracil-xanthine permease family protein n=1 Tax=Dethiosulfovibrio faecalis TaxID=2720018 RepID=UPI001F3A1A51|nr:solute carrier family 23 protein [Dethiosulfovibrio faecalis]MCF4151995.1 purine/pyrimidine permease [Dethiosulfovibrio faecalis]